MSRAKIQGIGVGIRRPYARELLVTNRQVDFVEVTPENWVRFGGDRRRLLDQCLERFPAVSHGVSLSIGGNDPLDLEYLDALSELNQQMNAPFFSDHLCYSSVNGAQLHDLLPLPFTEEVVKHTAARIRQVEDRVNLPFVLENATFYAHMPGGTLDEAEFLVAVLQEANCGLLLDVNNVYVNSQNHGFDPYRFIDRIPLDRVRQLHMAGHTLEEDVIIDTHIGPVIDPVWDLYRYTLRRAGMLLPTIIEWDQEIPPLDTVLDEVERARLEAAFTLGALGALGEGMQ